MKKLFSLIITVALLTLIFIGWGVIEDKLNIQDSGTSFLSYFNERTRQFKPDAESFRLFDGGLMGEHNVKKTENAFYNDNYFNQLSPNEQAVYSSIEEYDFSSDNVVAKLPEPVYFYSAMPEPTEEEMEGVSKYLSNTYQRALDALNMDGSKAFYIKLGEGGSMCSYEYRCVFQGERYAWCIEEITTKIVTDDCYADGAQRYISALESAVSAFYPTGDTMYQRVKSIHDYIINTGAYEETAYSQTAYGLLVEKKAVCSGFAKAFKLICDKNNIPCALVTGTGITDEESGEHMWCVVQMDDGLWYNVDPTWDDYGGYEFFLVGSGTVSDFSGLTFSETHIPDADFTGFGYPPFVYPSVADTAYLK